MSIEHVLENFNQFKEQQYFLFFISDDLSLQTVDTRPHFVYTDKRRKGKKIIHHPNKSISIYPHQYWVHSPTPTDTVQLATRIENFEPRHGDRLAEQYTALHIANKLLSNKLDNIQNDAKLRLTTDVIDHLRIENNNYEHIKRKVSQKILNLQPAFDTLKHNNYNLWDNQQQNPYWTLDEQLNDFMYSEN